MTRYYYCLRFTNDEKVPHKTKFIPGCVVTMSVGLFVNVLLVESTCTDADVDGTVEGVDKTTTKNHMTLCNKFTTSMQTRATERNVVFRVANGTRIIATIVVIVPARVTAETRQIYM